MTSFAQNLPRFLPNVQNTWPWANCSPGDEALQKRFSILARLHIPLGNSPQDKTVRENVIAALVKLNDMNDSAESSRDRRLLPIPKFSHKSKPGDFAKFFAHFMSSWSIGGKRDDNMAKLLTWAAKVESETYLQCAETANQMAEKGKAKVHFRKPDDLTMYDEGDPTDKSHVQWNLNYRELLQYKETHGTCDVSRTHFPEEISPEDSAMLLRMKRFTCRQRSQYKSKEKDGYFGHKRIELLESIGFVWESEKFANQYRAIEDPRFIASWAAKLYFSDKLTAQQAMLMAGLPDDIAGDDSRKKLLNEKTRVFYRKDLKKKPAVEVILKRLRESYVGNELAVLSDIFEGTDTAAELWKAGKLEPRLDQQPLPDEPPTKRHCTDL